MSERGIRRVRPVRGRRFRLVLVSAPSGQITTIGAQVRTKPVITNHSLQIEASSGRSKVALQQIAPPPLPLIWTIPTQRRSSAHSSYLHPSLAVVGRSSHAQQAKNEYQKHNTSWVSPTKTSLLRTRTSTSSGSWSTALRTELPKDFSRVMSGCLLLIYLQFGVF